MMYRKIREVSFTVVSILTVVLGIAIACGVFYSFGLVGTIDYYTIELKECSPVELDTKLTVTIGAVAVMFIIELILFKIREVIKNACKRGRR